MNSNNLIGVPALTSDFAVFELSYRQGLDEEIAPRVLDIVATELDALTSAYLVEIGVDVERIFPAHAVQTRARSSKTPPRWAAPSSIRPSCGSCPEQRKHEVLAMSRIISRADAERWYLARTLTDLGALSALWLEAQLATQPGYDLLWRVLGQRPRKHAQQEEVNQ